MNTSIFRFALCFLIFLYSCGGSKKENPYAPGQGAEASADQPAAEESWKTNHGIGPIKSLELPAEVDEALAAKGKEVYEAMCTACHKVDKKFIGPSPMGILERRTPEWVMNMILNPEEMIQNDPIAKQLLIEANGSPMANQNLTQEEARAVLEYFRIL